MGEKLKISIFELQKRYIPQKKAEIMQNLDLARKSMICGIKQHFTGGFVERVTTYTAEPVWNRVNPT